MPNVASFIQETIFTEEHLGVITQNTTMIFILFKIYQVSSDYDNWASTFKDLFTN